MPNTSLVLDKIILDELSFKINPDFKGKIQDVNFLHKLESKGNFDEKLNILDVYLALSTDDESSCEDLYPFQFSVVFLGRFHIKGEATKELIKIFSEVNCPAIILPYLRQCLADITMRGGYPPLYFPIINFNNFMKKKNTNLTATTKKSKRIK